MIAVVTGAGRGIGRSTALALAQRDCDVALAARTLAELEETRDLIVAARSTARVTVHAVDIRASAQVATFANDVRARLGEPDILVHSAGIVKRSSIEDTSDEQWNDVVDANLTGTFTVTRAFLAAMKQKAYARVIAVGSISSTLGTARQGAYAAAKWGVVGFMKSLAEELRGTGVAAMTLLPGSVDTAMLQGSGYEAKMSPADVAKVIVFLALDAPSAMNGSAIEMFG